VRLPIRSETDGDPSTAISVDAHGDTFVVGHNQFAGSFYHSAYEPQYISSCRRGSGADALHPNTVQHRHETENAVLVEPIIRGTHRNDSRGLPATGRESSFRFEVYIPSGLRAAALILLRLIR